MDIRNVDLNLLKTAPIAGKKAPEKSEMSMQDTDGFLEKDTPFEDILSKFTIRLTTRVSRRFPRIFKPHVRPVSVRLFLKLGACV